MYSTSIVGSRLAIAAEEIGFTPEYHSPSEVGVFNEQLERKYESIYASARAAAQGSKEAPQVFQQFMFKALCNPDDPKLNREEVRFMENERAIVASDAAYYLTRYYYLKDRENNLRLFGFQQAQRVLFDIIAELEELQISIELLIAKARQLGMTTLTVGLGGHKLSFSFGVSGIIASAETDKTEDMLDKMFTAYDLTPWWLRPAYTKRVNSAKGQLVFGGSRCSVRFQHGNQLSGMGRGSTPIFYDLSEVASYSNPEEIIEASLWKCVHPSPRVFGVMESTCEGNTGWWHDTYWYSKSNWPRCRMKTVFLPFYLEPGMYPNETWLRQNPVPAKWRKDQVTRRMIAESRMYVQSDPILTKVLGTEWDMPEATAWYWETQFLEARSKGQEKLWHQEMPHTDVAAFQGSYDNVFGKECIAEAWSKRDTKYAVYAIVGQSIEDRHEPDPEEVDYSAPRIPVSYTSKRGEVYRWEFVPLKWVEPFNSIDQMRDDESHMGKLFIYLDPEPGYDYSMGIDTSNGLNQDSTCIAVSRRGRTADEPDVQAAEFRSNKVSHVEAFAWGIAIASFYARHMADTTRYREPYVAVEQIAAVGDTCQLQMRKMGYTRFHHMIRYDSKPQDMRKSKSHKQGWYTSTWSRPILTDGFVILVQNGWYILNSPYTIYECDQWEVHYTGESGKSKFEHAEDATDDGIFANAMAAFCVNDLRSMAERTQKRPTGTEGKRPRLDIGAIGSGLTVRTV